MFALIEFDINFTEQAACLAKEYLHNFLVIFLESLLVTQEIGN